ncbi:hypothetical protein NQ317_013523 [Molorchus minor]|uniref:Uncharacterized protein n=1 Tax=Molorchus minor TaxID=1323400 RepID=A0ABQ9JV74_9CUCU|nr:hypothetical protein NQ317_013523 [Molorchus minor]
MVGAPAVVFPQTRNGHTRDHLRAYFQQLSIYEIHALYKLYEPDFRLFGYNLEDILGFELNWPLLMGYRSLVNRILGVVTGMTWLFQLGVS